jgi:hypothetical protein
MTFDELGVDAGNVDLPQVEVAVGVVGQPTYAGQQPPEDVPVRQRAHRPVDDPRINLWYNAFR